MKLFFQVYSSGSAEEKKKPPIIFLHGMGVSGKMYRNVAPIICQNTKRKAYVPDARNHGKSPWSDEMNYDVLTEDLLEFVQQNAIQKAVLIGNSMGGRTAMNFVLKYPEKVEALIIEDMTPRNVKSSGRGNVMQTVVTIIQDMLKEYPPDIDLLECKTDILNMLMDAVGSSFCNRERMQKNADIDCFPIVKDGNELRFECNVDVVASMLENDALVQDLPKRNVTFDGDALFLYGSRGFFKLGKDPSIKQLFPRAIVKCIEGASHFIHGDSPDEYSTIVSNFILHRSLQNSKY